MATDDGCKSLYVGNLDPRVTDSMLHEIFGVAGSVNNTKIIPDKNYQHGGLNYGFVEFNDHRSAETALQTLNGRKIYNMEIKVNWAFQGQQDHYHIFVGDLSPEVNDEVLAKAFSAFGSMSDARVMWDVNSGKSRGYGFVAFRDKTDAEQAIATMNGEWLGSRAIRCNWANQKGQPGPGSTSDRQGSTQTPALSYEIVVAQTPHYNSTVYVGNLPPYTTQDHLIPYFQSFGYIIEVRMQADRGFAFVKLDSHENAANAIVNLQNTNINGRIIKCSWGKDRAPEQATASYHAFGVPSTAYNYPYGYYSNHTAHPYPATVNESGYDLPPGMSAPPPSLASLDGTTAAAVVAGQQQHPTANWEQYSYNGGYDAYGQYFPYGYNQPTGAGAPGAPGIGTPTSSVAGSHPPSVGSHGPSGGSAYSG
ncbi:nuclear and cytoplasmic polyadenylated RNA-binding protein pub1 [Gigaspora margarita]|uniref:Nuclear and cytoplasmic polyadenylated RNA-binding protein pub1 n=1 Tax=Gigaspora margarita TaxID=4874 RepID=A0A8H4APF3_GIGMA|nr:nuclear and cytoplasmic polyadenylated RNA-binding protein pub1 [Gigaspora margarita]